MVRTGRWINVWCQNCEYGDLRLGRYRKYLVIDTLRWKPYQTPDTKTSKLSLLICEPDQMINMLAIASFRNSSAQSIRVASVCGLKSVATIGSPFRPRALPAVVGSRDIKPSISFHITSTSVSKGMPFFILLEQNSRRSFHVLSLRSLLGEKENVERVKTSESKNFFNFGHL